MTLPVVHFAPELMLAAQDVRVVFFDIDCVWAGGGEYFMQDGEARQRVVNLDAHGLKLLHQCGIVPVVLARHDSKPLREQLVGLGVEPLLCGIDDKHHAVERSLADRGLDWAQAAGMGSDWPDLPVLARCAFAAAPANAHVEVRARAHHVTRASGGNGAVRELCDLLMTASGHYATALAVVLQGSRG